MINKLILLTYDVNYVLESMPNEQKSNSKIKYLTGNIWKGDLKSPQIWTLKG